MLGDGDRAYTWDGLDQLVKVTSSTGAVAESTFNGAGVRTVRVERAASGETHTTYFLDDASEVVDGQLVRFIVHGGKRIARLSTTNGVPGGGATAENDAPEPPGAASLRLAGFASDLPTTLIALVVLIVVGRRYRKAFTRAALLAAPLAALAFVSFGCSASHNDGPPPILVGTIDTLSDADDLLFADGIGSLGEETSGTGVSRGSFASYPFGVTRSDSTGETRKYANNPRDASVGLDQMGARSFAPDLGVWTSIDPIAFESPTTSVGHSFGTANPYAYAAGNPTTFIDRSGYGPEVVVEGVGPFYLFAALAVAGAYYGQKAGMAIGEKLKEVLTPEPLITGDTPAPAPQLSHDNATTPPPPTSPTVDAKDLPKVGTHGGPRSRKYVTPKGRKIVIEKNRLKNGGKTRCETCGRETTPGKRHQKGVRPPANETHIDHITPRSEGGDGTPENNRVTCRECNLKKGSTVENPSVQADAPANDNATDPLFRRYTPSIPPML